MTLLALDAEPIPVTVITGFLGSGKTTLLRHLLGHPGFTDTAVIVNEFGEVGLDHVLLETSEDNTLLLDNGCLCCGLRSDLVTTLLSLFERRERGEIPRFRRVVIETSGLADPVPLLQTFIADPLRLSEFTTAGMVTCFDAVNGAGSVERHAEAQRQLALADTVVITKGDLAEPAKAREEARLYNNRALILEAVGGAVHPQDLLRDTMIVLPTLRAHAEGHDRIVSVTVTGTGSLSWDHVRSCVADLVERHGDRLLRLKGLLHVEGHEGPVAIDGVQHLFHRPRMMEVWPSGMTSAVLVGIAEGTSAGELDGWLRTVLPVQASTRSPSRSSSSACCAAA